ncbi:hypothetical protein CCR75_009516 [Bremia lactucae]|uniref:Uncharacterized protein n=1 Tax=Bremia lactucae TaxID=4779 RepID=A0A976IFG5_BRELC|nr:hypothetical protein CCR75_009516 [Bremia lactucae]
MGKKDRIERKRSKKTERLYPRKSHKSHDSKRPKRANKISADDYFLRQTEFRVWLVQTKLILPFKCVVRIKTNVIHILPEYFAKE